MRLDWRAPAWRLPVIIAAWVVFWTAHSPAAYAAALLLAACVLL